MRRTIQGWVLTLAFLAAGCRSGPSLDLPEGCATGESVPPGIRESVEAAAGEFYARARKGDWEAIYKGAATVVRTQRTQEAFVSPISRAFRELGFPDVLHREALSVVKFGPGFPHRTRVECAIPGEATPLTLILTDFPLQASLVKRGNLGSEELYFSTLWHREGSDWKLAGFFAKPATLLGKDWKAYEEAASAQRSAGNKRNAALLYNVAIDLVVPNAWTKPGEVESLKDEQSRISVDYLPKGKPELWPASPDSFRVHQVAYGLAQGALCVLLRYEAPAALADTAAQSIQGERLRRYVEESFPEYLEVFRYLALVAFLPQNPEQTWSRLYPLRRPS
jgi:hypothetical protein